MSRLFVYLYIINLLIATVNGSVFKIFQLYYITLRIRYEFPIKIKIIS